MGTSRIALGKNIPGTDSSQYKGSTAEKSLKKDRGGKK